MASARPKLLSTDFIKWLAAAGVVPSNTRRVAITAGVGDVVKVKAWLYGDVGLIEGSPPDELRTFVELVQEDASG